ncbi:hypothetical protein [Nocardia nova]|uniref:hypothetical protein n=1 Tax=Nocardia nova TaxID=37330 RepID=UPI0033C12648
MAALSLTTRRIVAAPLLALALTTTTATIVQPAPAQAKSSMTYIERPCLVRSPVKNGGPNGDGCSVYGMSKWVSTGDRPDFPEWGKKAVKDCLVAGASAAAVAWMGGPETYAGAMVVMAISCVGPTVVDQLFK